MLVDGAPQDLLLAEPGALGLGAQGYRFVTESDIKAAPSWEALVAMAIG